MSKSDPIEMALNAIGDLRTAGPSAEATKQLGAYLGNRSNLVVAQAAKVVREQRLTALLPELVKAFERKMANPAKLDKRCAAVTEIVHALYEMDYMEPEVYLLGIRHVQKEASFGPPVDTAAALRGMCAQGLLRTRYADALPAVVDLLVDTEPPARLGAVRALGLNGGEAGALLLRLKILTGEEAPEVMSESLSGLMASAPEASVSFVARFLDGEDEVVAEAAAWALGQSRQAAALEALKEKWGRTVDRALRKTIMAAIAASRLQEAVDYLCVQLRSASVPTAVDIMEALGRYAASESVKQTVRAAVDERDERKLMEMFQQQFGGMHP
jgi:hypothetical protein